MKITNIKIFKTKRKAPVLGFANIILDNKYAIRGITLLENDKGRYLGMPSRKIIGEKTIFRDICHPVSQDVRDELTKKVFDAYDEFIKNEE